jgi:hypothetical protein
MLELGLEYTSELTVNEGLTALQMGLERTLPCLPLLMNCQKDVRLLVKVYI